MLYFFHFSGSYNTQNNVPVNKSSSVEEKKRGIKENLFKKKEIN